MKRIFVFFAALLLVAASGCTKAATFGEMRPFPQPFSAMLAVCSDIDGSTPEEFEQYHKFLNSTEGGEMGQGLGLDIADSFWMFMANDSKDAVDKGGRANSAVMTYFFGTGGDYKNANLIKHYIESGWIDSMHSFGDFSMQDEKTTHFSRELAERAAGELYSRGLWPTVWMNHGNASNVQNLRNSGDGADYQQGGSPDSPYYHADLTIPGGVKFIWFSDPSAKFGLNTPLYRATLEDGRKVWGFSRYTGEKDGLFGHKYNWSIYDVDKQLSKEHLDGIVRDGSFAVVAQHLGGSKEYVPLLQAGRDAFATLAQYQKDGKILVARTSRLLEYARVRDNLVFIYSSSNAETIDIQAVDDPQLGRDNSPQLSMLRGMTFYVRDADSALISINGSALPEDEVIRTKGAAGQDTVGIRWFLPDTRNFTYGGASFYH